MTRLTITLRDAEKRALFDLAQRELRNPRDQAVILIRNQLEAVGMIRPRPQEAATDSGQRQQLQGGE